MDKRLGFVPMPLAPSAPSSKSATLTRSSSASSVVTGVRVHTSALAINMTMQNPEQPSANLSRRQVLSTVLSILATSAIVALTPSQSRAAVYFDTERYGDKEMKVSAINKVKQAIRNILAERPDLLPTIMACGVHDALSYSVKTDKGGPNGSLRYELGNEYNKALNDAANLIVDAKLRLKDDISLSDYFAFCGAVASEVVGGPRIVIQLGREDAKQADEMEEGALDGLRSDATGEQIKATFARAGFDGANAAVLFHGAYGMLNSIGQKKAEQKIEDDSNADEDAAFEEADVTYGRVTKKQRGAVLVETNVATLTLPGVKFDNSYLKELLAVEKKGDLSGLSKRDLAMLQDPELKAQVQRYAGNSKSFVNDFASMYEKCTLLGSRYDNRGAP